MSSKAAKDGNIGAPSNENRASKEKQTGSAAVSSISKSNGTGIPVAKKMNGKLPAAYSNSGKKRPAGTVEKTSPSKKLKNEKKDPLMPIDAILDEMDNFENEKRKAKKKEESDDESSQKRLPKASTPIPGTFKVPTFNDLTKMENDNSIVFTFLERNQPGVNEMVLAYKMLRGRVDPFYYGYFERTKLKPANIKLTEYEEEGNKDKKEFEDKSSQEETQEDGFKFPVFVPDDDQTPASQAARRNQVKAYLAKHIGKPIAEVETYLSEEHWQLMGTMKQDAIFKVIDQLVSVLCKSTAMKSPEGNSGRNSVAMDISSDEGSVKTDSQKKLGPSVMSAPQYIPTQPPITLPTYSFQPTVIPQYYPSQPTMGPAQPSGSIQGGYQQAAPYSEVSGSSGYPNAGSVNQGYPHCSVNPSQVLPPPPVPIPPPAPPMHQQMALPGPQPPLPTGPSTQQPIQSSIPPVRQPMHPSAPPPQHFRPPPTHRPSLPGPRHRPSLTVRQPRSQPPAFSANNSLPPKKQTGGGTSGKPKRSQNTQPESPKKKGLEINMDLIRKMPPPPIPKIIQQQRAGSNPDPSPPQRFQRPPPVANPQFPTPPNPTFQSRPPDNSTVMRTLFNVLRPGTPTTGASPPRPNFPNQFNGPPSRRFPPPDYNRTPNGGTPFRRKNFRQQNRF